MRKNNKAFTLVELLAVIVLLGILALLTFPKILEMVNREQDKISEAKLNLMYTATKSYLFDYSNQFPEREGNTYCITPKELEEGNYLSFELDEIDTDYVIKVSYFSDSEYQLSYVKSSSCTNNGNISTELAGLSCKVDKTGYSLSKRVTVTFPESDEFIYQYSLDEGKTWKEVTKFDEGNKVFFNFTTSGSVLAKALIQNTTDSVTCSAYVDQIDPTPIGTIVAYAGDTVPSGYLLADGSSVSRSKYTELYDVISRTYGTPSSSKFFYLPDLSGKLVVGTNSSDSDLAFGMSGGEKNHTLTVDELPTHTHTFTGTSNVLTDASGEHTHTFSGTTVSNGAHNHYSVAQTTTVTPAGTQYLAQHAQAVDVGAYNMGYVDSKVPDIGLTSTATNHNHTFSGTTAGPNTTHTHTVTASGSNSSTGSGKEHNNLMPYITLKYIIKYQ